MASPDTPVAAPADALPAQLVDEAIAWAVRLDFNRPSASTRQAFEAWLNAGALHAQAWARVRALSEDFQRVPAQLASDTLQAAQTRRQAQGLQRRRTLQLLSGAGVAVAAGWLVHAHVPWQRLLASASTAVGEQQTLRLADGSQLWLNTDSAISTAFDAAQRLVVLRRGEILVRTGADTASPNPRPFWVQTPFGRLQALGARFVVRLDAQRARISVQDGAVRMHSAQGGTAEIARPGTHWWLAAQRSLPAPAPGFAPDDWAEGVIAGREMRLADLLAELERYRHGRIVCDARVADLRLSGTYQLRDTDQALRFLAQTQPLRIRMHTRWWVQVEPVDSA